ncbi:MAG: hypothetical protein EZS28_033884 [Streblomastix strix]|uniref:Peptidase S8/S53 domain-containing protein n=1 Tax=Streblomastix strix TaxID=222440 RepID=A0A5J4UJ08_9EUKA|nr:MAG: hypothetical protein EZS28_033884 [Streblomastix strix]
MRTGEQHQILTNLKNSISKAVDKGIIVVASSGDTGEDRIMYPAKYDKVISVSGQGKFDKLYLNASFNEEVNYVISGEEIIVQGLSHKEKTASGSSYSSAILSGMICFFISKNRGVDKTNIIEKLDNYHQSDTRILKYKDLVKILKQ